MKLYTYYGVAKTGKIRKKRAIVQMFANDAIYERQRRVIDAAMHVAYTREQTTGEMEDAKYCNRVLISYDMFIDEKPFNGSLNRVLDYNEAAETTISISQKKEIRQAIERLFISLYRDYKEPITQLSLF